MRAIILALAALAISSAAALAQEQTGWRMEGSAESPPLRLSLDVTASVRYVFECDRDRLRVTQTGVTQLMNLQSGEKIGDAPGSVLPPDTAMMGLFTDRVEPDMVRGAAVPNATNGWDITIELGKTDRAFLSLARANMLSLMTTGWTGAVELSRSDRRLFASFIEACRGL